MTADPIVQLDDPLMLDNDKERESMNYSGNLRSLISSNDDQHRRHMPPKSLSRRGSRRFLRTDSELSLEKNSDYEIQSTDSRPAIEESALDDLLGSMPSSILKTIDDEDEESAAAGEKLYRYDVNVFSQAEEEVNEAEYGVAVDEVLDEYEVVVDEVLDDSLRRERRRNPGFRRIGYSRSLSLRSLEVE
jgi:hypothetical protein